MKTISEHGGITTIELRCARYACIIPGTRVEPLGFASLASAARVMDEILTPIPIELMDPKRGNS